MWYNVFINNCRYHRMVEMISKESIAPNKPQKKKTIRYIEFGQFKESNHNKGYPKIPKLKISFLCISAMVMIFSHCRLF